MLIGFRRQLYPRPFVQAANSGSDDDALDLLLILVIQNLIPELVHTIYKQKLRLAGTIGSARETFRERSLVISRLWVRVPREARSFLQLTEHILLEIWCRKG